MRQRCSVIFVGPRKWCSTEEAGFIRCQTACEKKSKDTIYRLADEFSLFHLKWMERGGGSGAGSFLSKSNTPAWRAWSGYALEALALKHPGQVKSALGIARVDTSECGWVHRPNETWLKSSCFMGAARIRGHSILQIPGLWSDGLLEGSEVWRKYVFHGAVKMRNL